MVDPDHEMGRRGDDNRVLRRIGLRDFVTETENVPLVAGYWSFIAIGLAMTVAAGPADAGH